MLLYAYLLYLVCLHVLGYAPNQFIVDGSNFPGWQSHWDNQVIMHSGLIDVGFNSSLFFWKFSKPNNSDIERPLVIWLNGGPGCSSMDGALMEVGPLRISDNNAELKWNKGWFDKVDLLFIDQPIGTGFSIKGQQDEYNVELKDSVENLMIFMDEFFKIFGINNHIMIAGESYAGQYIPHFAKTFITKYRLDSVLIGNGWLDGDLQSLSFIPFSLKSGLIKIDNKNFASLLQEEEKCQNLINKGSTNFIDVECESILRNLLIALKFNGQCLNVYDIKKMDSYPACGTNWPEILPNTIDFLNLIPVQESLNIYHENSKEWKECDFKVGSKFKPVKSQNGAQLLNHLSGMGVQVGLFSGLNDLICNYVGTEMVIEHYGLGSREKIGDMIPTFEMDYSWKYNGENVGEVMKEGNLTYMKVYNSSHMVAYDISEISIGLLDIMIDWDKIKKRDGVIYLGEGEGEGKDKNTKGNNASSTRGNIQVILLAGLLVSVVGVGIYYLKHKKSPGNYEQLNRKKNKKNKRVHWSDLEEFEEANFGEDIEQNNVSTVDNLDNEREEIELRDL